MASRRMDRESNGPSNRVIRNGNTTTYPVKKTRMERETTPASQQKRVGIVKNKNSESRQMMRNSEPRQMMRRTEPQNEREISNNTNTVLKKAFKKAVRYR